MIGEAVVIRRWMVESRTGAPPCHSAAHGIERFKQGQQNGVMGGFRYLMVKTGVIGFVLPPCLRAASGRVQLSQYGDLG